MALTEHQLQTLRTDLQTLANIEYNDVMTELLDHYASLTEQYMADGLPFTEASKRAWSDLGSGAGLQAIQTDFIRTTQRHLRQQHWTIVKSYFRWPILLTTVLMGILLHLVVPMIPARGILLLLFVIGAIPAFIIQFTKAPSTNGLTDTSQVLREYLRKQAVILVSLANAWLNVGAVLFDSNDTRLAFLDAHSSFFAVVLSILLLYVMSFSQLLYLHFRAQLFLAAVNTTKLFN
ncbi:hypothetical protein [Spirosoma pomorum]